MTDDRGAFARYFAVPDPLANGAPSCWYVRTSRGQATIEPWPPNSMDEWIAGKIREGASPVQIEEAFAAVQSVIHADPDAAARRFAMEQARCYSCGRALVDAESLASGIGPECDSKREQMKTK